MCDGWLLSAVPVLTVERAVLEAIPIFWLIFPVNPEKPVCSVFICLCSSHGGRRGSGHALSLCKKVRRKLKSMSLRLTFARTDCYPYDTLCTYEVEQLKLLGFSRRYLFWFY